MNFKQSKRILSHSTKRYLSLSSSNAILEYIQKNYGINFAPNSIKISIKQCDGYMFLNTSTLLSLEVLINARDGKMESSLFSTINHTVTPMGKRLLKSSLLQPLNDIGTINNRLDCVTELLERESEFLQITNQLKSFFDLGLK
jgi:DNA mismatch repair protein MSH4